MSQKSSLHEIGGLLAEEILKDQLKPAQIIVNDTENVDIGACPVKERCLYVNGTNISSKFYAFKEASLKLSKKENGGLYVESNVHEILQVNYNYDIRKHEEHLGTNPLLLIL
jgi:hypothetical protein